MRRYSAWLILALAIAAGACARTPDAQVQALAVDGRVNATPSIATRGDLVAVAWSASTPDGSGDIHAAVSRNGGRTFGAAVRVNDVALDARAGGEQPPQIAFVDRPGSDPAIVVVWPSKREGGTILLQARSTDGGTAFTPASAVPGTDGPGNRGWHAVTIPPDGNPRVAWLDHRGHAVAAPSDAASPVAATHHQHGATDAAIRDGVEMAQQSTIYVGGIEGAEPPHALTAGVCYCCKTALASGGAAIYAAWRQVYPGNIRDIAFAASRDGGRSFSSPVRISDDRWVLNGCPENGPSMAVDGNGRIHVVWPTLVNGDGIRGEPALSLFYASSDDGQTFTPRQPLPTEGLPRHPQLSLSPDGRVVISWDEARDATRFVVVARGQQDGENGMRFERHQPIHMGPATYPALSATSDGAVLAWTSGDPQASIVRVQRVRW